jgi:hypothetical protein
MTKSTKTGLGDATFASVKKEMAEPRMANSVRKAEKQVARRTMPAARGKSKLKLRRILQPRGVQ